MTQFLSFVHKEFIHILRDVRTMLILLVMPVVMILLFGFAINTEVRNANVGIMAPQQDPIVRSIAQRLDASQYFNVTHTMHSNEEVLQAFQNGEVQLVVLFNSDNTELQLLSDGSEPNQASMVTNYARAIVMQQMQELRGTSNTMPIHITTRMLYNPQQQSAYNFVPGVMGLILMLICAMMTSISIVREREMGTMEVLLVSPLNPLTIIVAKLVPYFVLSMVNITTILLLSVFVLNVPVQGSLALLLFLCILFVILALSLGLFVSTVTNSQVTAMLISGMVFMMPVMLLSGMMFPLESMPAPLQWISVIVPARWFIQAVKMVMLQGCTLADVAQQVGILAAMAVVLMTVSIKNFKTRLQ